MDKVDEKFTSFLFLIEMRMIMNKNGEFFTYRSGHFCVQTINYMAHCKRKLQ